MYALACGGDHIPAPLSRLIGRDPQLALCRALLEDNRARLLTLTGPGGIGKTRLALELALSCAGAFAGGVHFVELASIASPELVPRAALDLLGAARTGSGGALDQLIQLI